MSRRAQPLFHEEQSFRLKRPRILLAIPPGSMLVLLIWQVMLGHPWGKQPMSNASVVGWTIFLWLVYLRLVTEVRAGEVSVAMRGFWRERRVPLSEISAAEAATYDAARDWGGYGIRTTGRGRAYIAGGNRGVRLKLANGSMILIGSEHPEELVSAVNRHVSTGSLA